MRRTKPKPQTRPVSYFPLPVRMFLLAAVGVVGCIWALVRYYTHPRPSMLVWVPIEAGAAADLEAGEVPAPEIEIVPEAPARTR